MEVSVMHQIYVCLHSLILGVAMGAIYDVFRIIRVFLGIKYVNKFTEKLSSKKFKFIKNPFRIYNNKEKSKKIAVFITDILYFLVITPIFMIFLYHQNNGIVRWFILFGAILGFLLYYFTLGKLIISVSEYIAFAVKVVFMHIIFFISRPFVPIARFIKTKISKIKASVKNAISRSKEKKKEEKKHIRTLIHFGKT